MKSSTKILLIDDKPENILAMESILESASPDYEFIKAYSAKEALKILLKEDDFALILMDVNMPEINGFDTASMIYQREKLSHIPIIFITANDYNEENLFKGYLSGGADYIFKPVNPELLKIKVRVFVELYRKNRQFLAQEQKLKQINSDLEQKIKEKFIVEEELRYKNIQLLDSQELTHLGSWDWNILTNKLSGSEEIYNIYGIEKSNGEFSMEKLLEKIHPADLENVRSVLANAISNKASFDIYFRYIMIPGLIKFINKKGRVITNEENEVVKVFGTSQDITELKKTEEQLRIFNLMEKMLNEIYIFSVKDFKFNYANEDSLRNLGYNYREITKLTLFDILSEYKKTSFKKMIMPLLNGKRDKIVFFSKFKRKDDTIYPVEFHLQLIDQEGKWESGAVPHSVHDKVFLAVVLDITERKRTEQVLASSLKEKETLLKEIHHRVKNNLQIIYSLLNLQSGSVTDERTLEIFKESQNRIKSMALIHEKLYKRNNLSFIDFTEYVNDLISTLTNSYNIEPDNILLKLNTEQVYLNIDLALSLGLCITELLTNCFKYAFPDGKKGEITLELKFNDENNLIISIKDNGIGLPENFDFENSDSLGLKLVSTLVDQHKGILDIKNNGFTSFTLEIPAKEETVSRSLELSGE